MTTQEFIALREPLGMSNDELAAELNVTPRLVQKWGDGRVAISERFALELQLLAFGKRADAAPATSGLSACPAVDDARARVRRGEKLSTNDFLNLNRHMRSCPVCQAREQYVTEHLGAAPAPAAPNSVTGRVFTWVAAWIGLLPEWARPAAGGAVILFGIVAGRAVFALPFVILRGAPVRQWLPMALVPFAAALGGAAGGFGYSFLGKPLRPIPVVGRYLAGVVTVAAYMAALCVVSWLMGAPVVTSESDAVVFASVTIFFGLVVGRSWFKPDDDLRARGPGASAAIGA